MNKFMGIFISFLKGFFQTIVGNPQVLFEKVVKKAKIIFLSFVKDKIDEVLNDSGFKLYIVNEVCSEFRINKDTMSKVYDKIMKVFVKKIELIFQSVLSDIESEG